MLNKKDADVSTCEQSSHRENVLSTSNKNEIVFDANKTFNCSVSRCMSKTNCFISIVVHCTDLNVGQCGMRVLTRCACSGVMLWSRYENYHMVRAEI